MATAMASYGFERMQHMSDDDLEESASTRNMTSASYPSPTPASRKSRSGAAASKSQDMKMVEIKHGSYDPSAQRWPHQDGGEGHHRRTVTASTTAPRRDYLREGHSPGERDHLLTQPTSPGRHARPHHHAHFPSTSSSPSSSATSTTATVTFTMTTSSSATSVSYSSSSTYSYSAPSPPVALSPATLPASSSGSLASSPPMLLVYPESPSSTLKKSKKQHHHHHHHHSKTKKRVTWVDESVEGTRLEEVIEVERYLTQHGSLSWWLELMWDNKPYFLLLLCIALLFLASLVFILYKLVF